MASHFDFVDVVVAGRDLVVTSADDHVCRLEPRESDLAWYCDVDDGTPTDTDRDPASFVRWVCPALRVGSDIDKPFLLAKAHDDGPSKMAYIQQRLDVDVNYASQYRLRRISTELMCPTRHGYADFALPYLREYLREHAAADV